MFHVRNILWGYVFETLAELFRGFVSRWSIWREWLLSLSD